MPTEQKRIITTDCTDFHGFKEINSVKSKKNGIKQYFLRLDEELRIFTDNIGPIIHKARPV